MDDNSMAAISIKAGAVAATLREVIENSETAAQTNFIALTTVACEQAIVMQEADPEIFKEHGGIEKWVLEMMAVAIRETRHAMILAGRAKN